MKPVEFEGGAIQVDAGTIAKGLGIMPQSLKAGMREGSITSACERGIDEDSGRYRLTFFSANRRFRLVVDDSGKIIQRSTLDFGERPLPRRHGA